MNPVYILLIFLVFIFVSPLLLVISLLIFFSSGLPILYRQKRIGYKGKPFMMVKFRTMIRGAEHLQRAYKRKNEADGPVFKIHDDPRFTPIGRFLSHIGLDELPQLWNVLVGDMALFGPRPLPVSEAKRLLSWQRKRQHIKPGIISPWVLDGYHVRTFSDWMRSDCRYVQDKNFRYDARLFFRSLLFMVKLLCKEMV